jgi:hypothetical protein
MADVKISQLPSATLPVAGTEVLPIVQSSVTSKVSISNILSAPNPGNVSFSGTGNRITGDFSNATPTSRVSFQSSTTNGSTNVTFIPNGTGTSTGLLLESDSANSLGANFQLVNVSGTESRLVSGIRGAATYAPMTFYTGGSERLRIDTSGNVGIGTSSPATKIQVVGAGTTSANYTNGDAAGATLYLQDSGTSSGNGGQLLFGSGFGISAGIKSLVTNGTGPAGDLVFQTRTTTGNVTEKMRINDVGNVGIGVTANASAILDVQSTTKGVRMPNMTTTQKNAIASPAAGLMVFDTTLSKLSVYSGAAWQTITSV